MDRENSANLIPVLFCLYHIDVLDQGNEGFSAAIAGEARRAE
jgi:hypothetical protein